MKQIAEELISTARKEGADSQVIFNGFLDYLLDAFSLDRLLQHDGNYTAIFEDLKDEGSIYFTAFSSFVTKSYAYIEEKGVYDFFGSIYENMFQNGSKASKLGQFFTPQEVANLCAACVNSEGGVIKVNEPTCGSGRNLLSVFAKKKSIVDYYVAEDIDSLSVKMCAVNMMIHGMRGVCICHNTLFPDDFIFGYEINEVRYPILTPFLSIRRMSASEYKKRMNYEG